jgi:nicotinamide mononucleotide transporter
MRIKEILKYEITGWRWYELLYTAICTICVLVPSIINGESTWSIISATCGVISVVLSGKGKISTYLFGGIQCAIYSVIAYNATYYGETILNLFYCLPMEFVGIAQWSRHLNKSNGEVEKITMTWRQRGILFALLTITTIIFGYTLQLFGDAMPYVDSFTTISTMIAFYLIVKRYSENWWIWVIINIFSVYMWVIDYKTGTGSLATLLMWCIYLINSIIMLVRWQMEANRKLH